MSNDMRKLMEAVTSYDKQPNLLRSQTVNGKYIMPDTGGYDDKAWTGVHSNTPPDTGLVGDAAGLQEFIALAAEQQTNVPAAQFVLSDITNAKLYTTSSDASGYNRPTVRLWVDGVVAIKDGQDDQKSKFSISCGLYPDNETHSFIHFHSLSLIKVKPGSPSLPKDDSQLDFDF